MTFKSLSVLWIVALGGCVIVDKDDCPGCDSQPQPQPEECWQYFTFQTDGSRLIGDWIVTGQGEGWIEASLTDLGGYWSLAGTWSDGQGVGELWGWVFLGEHGRLEVEGYGQLGDRNASFYGVEGDRLNEGDGWFAFSTFALDARFVDGEVQGSWAGRGESGALRGVYDDDGVVYTELEGSTMGLWADGVWWGDESWFLWEATVNGPEVSAWGWLYGEAGAADAAVSVPTHIYPFLCE